MASGVLLCLSWVLVSVVTMRPAMGQPAAEHECSISSDRVVTAFSGETDYAVNLPCKYRLADFTCGDYRVRVTPGNSPVPWDMQFTPVTVLSKVVHRGSNQSLEVRTSLRRLRKYKKGKANGVWSDRDGSLSLDVTDYDSTLGAAVLRKDGVFDVEFTEQGDVTVRCHVTDFTSRPVPETLCGDGENAQAMEDASAAVFTNGSCDSNQCYVNYLVLTDEKITQSQTCGILNSAVKNCNGRADIIAECDVIYEPNVYECLGNLTHGVAWRLVYEECLETACEAPGLWARLVREMVTENCNKE